MGSLQGNERDWREQDDCCYEEDVTSHETAPGSDFTSRRMRNPDCFNIGEAVKSWETGKPDKSGIVLESSVYLTNWELDSSRLTSCGGNLWPLRRNLKLPVK